PCFAISGKDAVAELGKEVPAAHFAELEVIELSREQGLDILGIRSHISVTPEHVLRPCRSFAGFVEVHVEEVIRNDVVLVSVHNLSHQVDAEWQAIWPLPCWLASELSGFPGVVAIGKDGGDHKIDDRNHEQPQAYSQI